MNKLTVSIETMNAILQVLQNLPYIQVSGLIDQIKKEVSVKGEQDEKG